MQKQTTTQLSPIAVSAACHPTYTLSPTQHQHVHRCSPLLHAALVFIWNFPRFLPQQLVWHGCGTGMRSSPAALREVCSFTTSSNFATRCDMSPKTRNMFMVEARGVNLVTKKVVSLLMTRGSINPKVQARPQRREASPMTRLSYKSVHSFSHTHFTLLLHVCTCCW